jgi:hypothetical protein
MNRPETNGKKTSKMVILAVSLAVGLVAVQSSGWSARAEASEGRRISDGNAHRGAYDPGKIYTGAYEPQRIYKLVQGPQEWRPNRRPMLLREVTCRDARRALEDKGTWTGRLAQDGSCRTGDETEFATGNYMNFQEGPRATDNDLDL